MRQIWRTLYMADKATFWSKKQTYGQLSNHEQRCNWKNFSLKKQWKIASAFGPRTLFLLIREVNTWKIFGNLTSTTRWRPHKMKCVQTNRTLCCTHIQGIYKSEIYERQILRCMEKNFGPEQQATVEWLNGVLQKLLSRTWFIPVSYTHLTLPTQLEV